MSRLYNHIKNQRLKHEYQYEKKHILDILSKNPCNSQDIKDSIEKKVIKRGVRRCSYESISSRVENALSYLLENMVVDFRNNLYYLTDIGKAEVQKVKKKELNSFLWIKKVTSSFPVIFIFIFGSLLLSLVKMIGFSLTGNVIFLADSFSSFFGVVTIIMISLSSKIKHETLFTRIIQIGFVIIGIAFLIFGINRIINPVEVTDFNTTFNIAIVAVIIGISLLLYLYISSSINDSLEIKVYFEKVKSECFVPLLALLPAITEFFGLTFFEGFIVLSYGFIIMSEAIRINMHRYTRHALIFLNERPYSFQEILDIDNRIATLFGAPLFFEELKNPTYLWWNKKGIEYLQKKGYIKIEGEMFLLTEKGIDLAEESSTRMVHFLRFISSLVKPVISPILSLILHLFLGTAKLLGFVYTGSVGLLGDGLDSAIDGISSLIVGVSMKIKKETEATYLLILMMILTGGGVLISSINRILQPVALKEESLAIIIAAISIVFCFLLYLYQRYSGYINQNLAILTQSEDSKNHVLNALLVLIAVSAGYFHIYILDGLVGCFIGFIILKGAYDIFGDLRAQSQGETIDFEKYKLGVWKSYNKFQYQMLKNWILYQILDGKENLSLIENVFEKKFHPFKITSNKKGDFIVNYSYTKDDLQTKIKELLDEGLVQERVNSLFLTEKGKMQIGKAIKRYKHH